LSIKFSTEGLGPQEKRKIEVVQAALELIQAGRVGGFASADTRELPKLINDIEAVLPTIK